MNIELASHNQNNNLPALLLISSFIFSYFYIDIGFSLKPYMVISVLIFLISLNKFVIHKMELYEIFLLSYILYYSFTGFLSKYSTYSLRLIMGLLLILFCYFVMKYILSLANINNIEFYIAIVGIILSSLSLLLYLIGAIKLGFNFNGNGIVSHGLIIDRGIPRLIGIMKDPNIYSYYSLLFFFYYLTHINNRLSKIGIVLILISIILSFSRGGYLALFMGILVYLLLIDRKKRMKFISVTSIIIFLILFSLKATLNLNIYEVMKERFLNSDGGSGRTIIWEYGFKFLENNPFFGIGIFNFQPYTNEILGHTLHLHNTYLDALVEGGFIGLSLFLLLLFTIVISYIYNSNIIKDNYFILLTLVSIITFMATYSLIANEIFYFVLALFWRYKNDYVH